VDALPGGGAEVFSERLRKEWWPNKIGPAEWLAIHEQAHELGLPTNATMLFGIGETWPERVEHLLALRASQDRRPGYVCFIPLAFQPGEGQFVQRGPTPLDSLLVLALSRLVLDNVDHIKSYWPTVGIEVAGTGLGYGADDMDGTLTRERIMHAAGASTPTGMIRRRMSALIALAGFAAVERDGRFVPLSPPATGEPAAGSTVTGDAAVGTHSRRDPVEAPKSV
jgi:aminodeoxyfutalosine synthase